MSINYQEFLDYLDKFESITKNIRTIAIHANNSDDAIYRYGQLDAIEQIGQELLRNHKVWVRQKSDLMQTQTEHIFEKLLFTGKAEL